MRGKRHLAHRILRVKIKGQGARKPAKPSQEPNFYQMTYLPAVDNSSKAKAAVEPRSLPSYSRMQQPNNNNNNASNSSSTNLHNNNGPADLEALFAARFLQLGNPTTAMAADASFLPRPPLLPSSSLDQVLMMQQQQPAFFNYSFPPAVLSTLVKEQADAAELMQQLRRR